MKKLLFSVLLLLSTVSLFAQPTFDLGLKAGVNFSNVTADLSEYTTESVVKAHFGAFGRVGWGRIYIQPEAYFSSKGGDLSSGVLQVATSFDYNTVDVPMLLGVNLVKGGAANVRAMAGPVFSFLTANNVEGDNHYSPQYFKDNYFGFQYGIGVDVLFMTLDARMEHGSNDLYVHPDLAAKNKTFMVTLGFKIL